MNPTGRWSEIIDAASRLSHAEVAATAAELGVDHLVTVGPTEYGRGRAVADVAAALDLLRAELEPGDVVLVKASRAVGLDRLADALVQEREPVA